MTLRRRSRHSSRTERTQRSIRGQDRLDAFRRKHRLKGARELGAPILEEESHRRFSILKLTGHLAGLLGYPCGIKLISAPSQVHSSRAYLDEEQHIHRLQEDRLDREKTVGNVGPWSSPAWSFTIAAGMSSASLKSTATPKPTFASPTSTPETSTNATLLTVEAESASVARSGNWTAQSTSNGSGGAYLYSRRQAAELSTAIQLMLN